MSARRLEMCHVADRNKTEPRGRSHGEPIDFLGTRVCHHRRVNYYVTEFTLSVLRRQ